MFAALLPLLGTIFQSVATSFFPNPEDELKRMQLQQQLQLAMLSQASDIEKAAAENVKAEAQSEHWLAACWRPIVMLVFTGLIVARWLGFSAPGLAPDEVLKLWDIIQLGLGGYVIGRSAEKIAVPVAQALAAGKGK